MKDKNLGSVTLLTCFMLFALLFASGLHRLIESPNMVCEPVRIRVVPAYLCSVPPASQSADEHCAQQAEQNDKRIAVEAAVFQAASAVTARNDADSNGNILCAESYLRSVYQSFALGDGFV